LASHDPIGQLADGLAQDDTRIVGVVSDIRESSLEEDSSPEVYVLETEAEPDGENLVVRTAVDPQALGPSVCARYAV
jgi:hypothetical protein